jgi:hypothetical protein
MTTHRKKRGRPPSLWHGPRGKEFVTAVRLAAWDRRPKGKGSIAHAINVVVRRQRRFPELQKYSNRYLEKQFLAAEKFWNPYRKLRKLYEASKAKARTLIGG